MNWPFNGWPQGYTPPPQYPQYPQQPVVFIPVAQPAPTQPQKPPKGFRKAMGLGRKSPTIDDLVNAQQALENLNTFIKNQEKLKEKPKEEKKATSADKVVAFIILTFAGPPLIIGYVALVKWIFTKVFSL